MLWGAGRRAFQHLSLLVEPVPSPWIVLWGSGRRALQHLSLQVEPVRRSFALGEDLPHNDFLRIFLKNNYFSQIKAKYVRGLQGYCRRCVGALMLLVYRALCMGLGIGTTLFVLCWCVDVAACVLLMWCGVCTCCCIMLCTFCCVRCVWLRFGVVVCCVLFVLARFGFVLVYTCCWGCFRFLVYFVFGFGSDLY